MGTEIEHRWQKINAATNKSGNGDDDDEPNK